MKNVSNETRNAFMGWLASAYSGSFGYAESVNYYTIIRVCKNENFDYLYTQRHYNGIGLERRNDFDYAGIYCKQDGLAVCSASLCREGSQNFLQTSGFDSLSWLVIFEI